ncbi:PucR family transcriptional regulator [Saccharothrix sp. ALI-22-I]|nr:PucR family transcriptional regulator [Saccharothrix sp. ALI-22-I]
MLTVADVLALPLFAAGLPTVVTGESGLDRPVRWVHITELTDPASFLKGGELVLTTGMPLPTDPSLVRRYVDELADVGAAALVIELVRRFHRAPDALVRACRTRGLPLVTLAKDVNFLEVTQVVHALILGNHAEAMQRTQQIHDAFTALTLRGAGPEDVMRAAAEMSGHTVVLENLAHQALICEAAGRTVAEALTDWERRSRAVPPGDDTDVRGPERWLVTPVEYRGERWGRVAMLPTLSPPAPGKPAHGTPFGPEDVTVLVRTAMALTIARLIHTATWERRAHRNLLQDIAEQRHRSPDEARVRAAALGVPTKDTRYVAVLVDTSAGSSLVDALEPWTALVGELSPGRVGVLLALRTAQPWRPVVEQLSHTALDVDPSAVVSVGSEVTEVTDLAHAARSFRAAARVAEAVLPGGSDKPFHELSDIGLRQLLYTLREDVRVQDYVERQIGRLVEHDVRHHTDLLPTLRHYLDAAGNKTTAARRGDLSRQTLYQRLATIERLLDCDLESGERRTELHVALMALGVLRLG